MIEHKPLIEYLPPFLAEYREYQALLDVLWDEINDNSNSIIKRTDNAMNNTFVDLANLEGIKHWERMLNIVPNASATLEERRGIIKIKLVGRRPFTMRKLKEILDQTVTPGEYEVTMVSTFTMLITIELTSRLKLGAVEEIVRKIIPANIGLTVSLMYNQYVDYDGIYTHGQMAPYTHYQLREEVIGE